MPFAYVCNYYLLVTLRNTHYAPLSAPVVFLLLRLPLPHTHTHWRVRKNRDGSIRWVNQSALSNNCSLYFYYDQCNFSSSSSSSSSICPSEFLIFHPFFQTPVCQFLCVPITTNNLLASVTNCCLELAFYSSIIVLFTCANANYKVQLNFPNKNHRPMWLLFFVSIRRTTIAIAMSLMNPGAAATSIVNC